MSLAFLAKKSWHTTNLVNVERVWQAEQKSEKETKKVAELQKQIEEERQIQELRQLQVQNGQKIKDVDSTLDWMYSGPSAMQQESAEDYLLGKIYKPQEEPSAAATMTLAKKEPGSLWNAKVSSKNDSFTRLHEDPMLIIKQNEKQARENVLNNPVKMARIRHKIAAELEDSQSSASALKDNRDKERSHKHHKSHKDHKKHKKHYRDEDHKHSSSHKAKKSKHEVSGTRDRNRSRSNSVSSRDSRGSSDRGRVRRGRERDSGGREGYSRERHYPNDRKDRVSDRSRDREDRRDDRHSRSHFDHKNRSYEPENEHRGLGSRTGGSGDGEGQRAGSKSDVKYGLNRRDDSDHSAEKASDKSYLGPNVALLKQKEEKDKAEYAAKHKPRENVSKLSSEEKARRLREMMGNADKAEESRVVRLQESVDTVKRLESERDSCGDGKSSRGNGNFFRDMHKEIYNLDGADGAGDQMQNSMQQRRHYLQKGDDLEGDGRSTYSRR